MSLRIPNHKSTMLTNKTCKASERKVHVLSDFSCIILKEFGNIGNNNH